jgi:hypothetical protein
MNTAVNKIDLSGARKVTTAGRSMNLLSSWMARPADEKFLSLDDLVADRRARAERMTETTLSTRAIQIVSPEILESDSREIAHRKFNTVQIATDGGDLVSPTHWAFGQIAQRAKAPAAWLRTMPGPNVANDLTYALRYNAPADEVKLYADEVEACAITGPDYGRIFDWEVAEAVRNATAGGTGDHRWKVPGMLDWSTGVYDPSHPVTKDTTTLFANDRGVMIFLVQDLAPIEIGKLPDGSPDLVFRGFGVTNSEVGAGSMRIFALYLRAICCNRIFWGVEGFEEITMRHTKYAPGRFVEEAMPALASFANGSTMKLLEGVQRAKQAIVAETKEKALDFAVQRGLSAKKAAQVYERIMREEWHVAAGEDEPTTRPVSAWDFAQGVTSVARDELNFDARMDLEQAAGKLLDRVA